MIFPKDFEHKIGFTPLRQLLSEKCETQMGRDMAFEMSFKSNLQVIKRELVSTEEMRRLLKSGISLPQFSFYDIYSWILAASSPGSYIPAEHLYQGALTFHTMREIHDFFNKENHGDLNLSQLIYDFKNIPVFEDLEREIFRCIEKDGHLRDNASPELAEIRKNIQSLDGSMHRIMRRVIDSSVSQGLVSKDVTPVIREGRLVLPVSSANKRGISGIVHDTSATGKTVFIEPAEVVEAGNRMRELRNEEAQEIIRILINLTDFLRPYTEEIKIGCKLLSLYDFIKAKALFAIETGGEMPVLEATPELDWFHAVHPGLLLTLRAQHREPVAMNIKLDKENRILVISGPNAGGKSVSLKTVGTLQYMMQCGMLPTLYSNSHMGIFSNIFIDIGDEQSMENDLSTYSSHLSNMKFFLQHANAKTLILADEMGSGTEPQIGAALAQSILETLGKTGCFGVITTHYQNLKIFADNQEGFINGAMLYDRQHLRPTFQLSVGEPGSSFAIEIARNIGLPMDVINMAKEIVGSDYVDSERFLLDIHRDKRYWKNKRLEIKEKENRLNRLLEEYEDRADEIKQQRSQILRAAKQEAKDILKDANAQIERSIHEIRKSQAEKEKTKTIRKELEEYKQSLESEKQDENLPKSLSSLRHKSRKRKEQKIAAVKPENQESVDLQAGDYVKMKDGGVVGQIISIEGKNAEVAFGGLRTRIELDRIIPAQKPKTDTKNSTFSFTQSSVESTSRDRQLNFKTDIDVRGFRADEALQAITYFIDDAIQFNAKRVRILHGTGHGILRTLIRQHLKSNAAVSDFYDEDVRMGGAGITVVDLD